MYHDIFLLIFFSFLLHNSCTNPLAGVMPIYVYILCIDIYMKSVWISSLPQELRITWREFFFRIKNPPRKNSNSKEKPSFRILFLAKLMQLRFFKADITNFTAWMIAKWCSKLPPKSWVNLNSIVKSFLECEKSRKSNSAN